MKFWKNRFGLVTMLAATVALVTLTGCGKKSGASADGSKPIENTWHKVDTKPGADPSVPDSLGGAGFENIAAGMGFQTSEVKPEDQVYFGDPRAKTGGKLKMTISRYPLSFRPFFYGSNANFTENYIMSSMCYQPLLGTHPITLEYVPALASHWKISEDKLTFTFRIDPNARFWDGKPVTAEDVVATWKLVMDPTILSPSMQQSFRKFEAPVAVSKYIVTVKAKELNWRSFQTFATSLMVLQADQIGKLSGKEFNDKFQFEQPIGSGEYLILESDIKKEKMYTFTRRDDYWRKDYATDKYAGNFDRIEFTTIADNPAAEYETFQRGESDIFYYTSVTIENWINDTKNDLVQNNYVEKFRIKTDGAAGAAGIYFNQRVAPFNDINVRQAFYYLFDRESIINKLLYNEYEAFNSFYANGMYENKANMKYNYDPKKAAELLAKAGYTSRNADGILVKNGKPFVIEMSIQKPIEKFITPYQQTLQQAGIKLVLKFEDGNAITKNLAERNFKMVWVNYGGLTYPNPESSLSSELAMKNDNNNITGFQNAAVDKLIEDYKLAFTQAERVAIIQKIDDIVWQQCIGALSWNTKGIKLGVWQKFGFPEYMLSRQTQAGDHDLAIMGLWWYDADKAAKLEEARANKSAMSGTKSIKEVTFWKTHQF